nr:IS200/IS605 family transposase [Escherichia coli]
MKKETDIRRGRHCVFLMHVHLLFVTRYRRQIFDHDATEKLRTYFSNVCADFEAELVEMDGEPDHVHLLINYPPKLAISSLVNSLKGVSGRVTATRSTRYCIQVLLQRRFVESWLFCQ